MTIELNSEQPITVEDKSLSINESESSTYQDDIQIKTEESEATPKQQKEETLEKNKLLSEMLSMENKIDNCAARDIIVLPSIISRDAIPIFKQGTINLLQGKSGTHKTRLSELWVSLLISKNESGTFLHFKRGIDKPIIVCYIDTERNTTEELPSGIQAIKLKAGYRKDEKIANFRFTSIKQIERAKRLKAVEQFISNIRSTNTEGALFIILDVATDCCANFNDPQEALKLFDFVGKLCELYSATFLMVVHENPYSDKARGHLGTEATNKSSAVLSIGFEKVNDKELNIIHLKFLKLRAAKRPPPIYLNFNEDKDQLELASNDLMSRMLAEKELTTDVDSVAETIEKIMIEDRDYTQKELLTALKSKYKWVDNTLKARLKAIVESKRELININSEPCSLEIRSSSGKETVYRLVAINIATSLKAEDLINEQFKPNSSEI